jgi:hypothetical protein
MLFNKPETLGALLESGVLNDTRFNPERAMEVLHKVKETEGTIFNSAYIINGIPKKGAPEREGKAGTVVFDTLFPLWEQRKALAPKFKDSVQSSLDTLTGFHGMGRFMSYQVCVDLSYSKHWLANAEDLNEVTSPGPGTTKGAKFLAGNLGERGSMDQDAINYYIKEARRLSHLDKYWPVDSLRGTSYADGFIPLTVPNCSNMFCETSKAVALYFGVRDRLKNKYAGTPEKNLRQTSLF